MKRKEKLVFLCTMALCIVFISLVSLSRNYLGFGTETDYIGGFVPEAQRLMRGEPLLLEFHPPLYPMMLALVQIFTQDWFRTGVLISLVASTIALSTNFLFFYHLLGIYAAWGAVLGLISSAKFIEYSAYATSDVLFLALHSSALLISLLALRNKSRHLWILCGLVVGCIILTRTNGITFLLILMLPWWSESGFRQNLNSFIYFVLGLSVPLILWVMFALVSGSRLTPEGTYANFALTYFSPDDRFSGDARVQVEAQFDNLIEVLAYNPSQVVRTYIKDLFSLVQILTGMLQRPLNLFVPIGIVALFHNGIKNRKILGFYILLTLLQVLLLNFKAYEIRYFLFLLPILGAVVGKAFGYLISLVRRHKSRVMTIGFCLLCSLLAVTLSFSASWRSIHSSVGELNEAVPKVQNLGLNEASMVARKPHLPFYTNSKPLLFPNVETLKELKCYLETQTNPEDLFLYYGTRERDLRSQFVTFADPKTSPDWLKPVEQSSKPGVWVLYKYKPGILELETDCAA
ncbi:MAG: glycosyltransferase family 39 protein [Cyanobacteria bacterium P01_D01_bin.44]